MEEFPFLNPNLPLQDRINDLRSRMTLEEKVTQLVNKANPIERLNVPEYNWWNECLHGVARAGIATVFPQAIGMASTWNEDLIHRIAVAISDEARAKHHDFLRRGIRIIYTGLTMWSPNINIFRDPRWGRGQETYGEDPYLTSRIGVQFVKGLQGDDPNYLKTIATPKHYAVHSGPEWNRHEFDATCSERDLWDTYLPAFKAAIKEAGAWSIMGAYNRVNGDAACAHPRLLGSILREEWDFRGYVVSDCGAIKDIDQHHKIVDTPEEASALAIKTGCDLNCGDRYAYLTAAVRKGLIKEAALDKALDRLLEAKFRLGMFDPPEQVPYASIPVEIIDCADHRNLSLEAARQSLVLLKNNESILPLDKKIQKVAIIGPNADDEHVLVGNYYGTPSQPITIRKGMEMVLGNEEAIMYARGCELAEGYGLPQVIESQYLKSADGNETGLTASYFPNPRCEGQPAFTRVDASIDFNWEIDIPAPELDGKRFSARWEGTIHALKSGEYRLGVIHENTVRMEVEGELFFEHHEDHGYNTVVKPIQLEAGRSYRVRLEFLDNKGFGPFKLVWTLPSDENQLIQEATDIARIADAVVLVLGISPLLEGEEMNVPVPGYRNGDRLQMDIPESQQHLFEAISSLGKPLIVVLTNGSALAINQVKAEADALLEAWYPGGQGGLAIAEAIFGEYNPGGRLPITFYKGLEQLPDYEDYRMQGRTYRYFNGDPLFPFGFGLSYTHFSYSNLQISPSTIQAGDQVTCSATITNDGMQDGDEVVQLYLTDREASVPVAIRSLQGFQRIFLKKGETKTVEFTLKPEQMSVVSDTGQRFVEPGKMEISVGGKQPGFDGELDSYSTEVVTGSFMLEGSVKEIER